MLGVRCGACEGCDGCVIQGRKDVKGVLSGWGVELAIKNSEYKAVDDSKVKGELLGAAKSKHVLSTTDCV